MLFRSYLLTTLLTILLIEVDPTNICKTHFNKKCGQQYNAFQIVEIALIIYCRKMLQNKYI